MYPEMYIKMHGEEIDVGRKKMEKVHSPGMLYIFINENPCSQIYVAGRMEIAHLHSLSHTLTYSWDKFRKIVKKNSFRFWPIFVPFHQYIHIRTSSVSLSLTYTYTHTHINPISFSIYGRCFSFTIHPNFPNLNFH